jgi:hypothetical protein
MKRATVSLIKVKSCNALLRMLLVCIRSYLKSVLRHKFLILDTHHPDTIYLREQGCEDPLLFFRAKKGLPAKTFGRHCTKPFTTPHYKKTIRFRSGDRGDISADEK